MLLDIDDTTTTMTTDTPPGSYLSGPQKIVAKAEPVRSELAIRLEEMAKEQASGTTPDRPDTLPLDMIALDDTVFKLRGGDLYEPHLSELAFALKSAGELDRVTVMACGSTFYLTDGRHRLEAYRRASRTAVPVRYFEGTPEAARATAIRLGGKVTMSLSKQELGTIAWQNLLSGAYSLRAIARMTTVSRPNLDIMSKVRRALGEAAFDCRHWWQARQAYRDLKDGTGPKPNLTPDEWEAYEQERGRECADRLNKAFGDRLLRNPNIAAHALGIHLGRKAPEVAERLYQLGYAVEDACDDPDAPF